MKKIAILMICLFLSGYLFAQNEQVTTPGSYSMQFKFHYGFLMAHRPSIVHLQKKHIRGFEIDYFKQTEGSKSWQHSYNFPLTGISFKYFNLGNKLELGDAYAIMPDIKFPLLKKRHLLLMVNLGVGLGYVTKKWTVNDNYKNLAIGANWNAAISTGVHTRLFATKKTQIEAGIDLTHFSNGAAKIPNLGINIASLNFGLIKYFGEEKKIKRDTISKTNSKYEITTYMAGAKKSIDPPVNPPYAVFIFETDFHKIITNKSKIGIGTDLFIDQSGKPLLKKYGIEASTLSAGTRVGLHASYGLSVGDWSGYFQTGYYLITKIKDDGNIYSRLSLRYYINKHYFVCFNLKSHFARADYFEWGFGYKFK